MQAMELDSAELAKAVAKQLLQEGIIINRTHETVLRFLPPYILQKKHVDELVKALDAALAQECGVRPYKNRANKKQSTSAAAAREVHAHA